MSALLPRAPHRDLVCCREMAQPHLLGLPSPPCLAASASPSPLSSPAWCSALQIPVTALYCPSPSTGSPLQDQVLGHEATSSPGSLKPLLATHTTQCCTLICTSIPKLVHEEECEQTQTSPASLVPQIPLSIEKGLLASRSSFSQLHIYLRIPAKEATKVLETSPAPPPTPHSRIFTPQHLPPPPRGSSYPCPGHSSPLLCHFSFPPDHQCLCLPACLSLFLSFCIYWKKCSCRRKCNEIKRCGKKHLKNLLDRHFLGKIKGQILLSSHWRKIWTISP